MKTTLYCTLTLLTFVSLAFVPSTIAQDNSPEYLVRVIYFIPNDREPDLNMDKKLDRQMNDAQQFYADQMEAHGFGRKTFRFEANETGNVVVHHVNGKLMMRTINIHQPKACYGMKLKKCLTCQRISILSP